MSDISYKNNSKQSRKSTIIPRNYDGNTDLQPPQCIDSSDNAVDFETLIDNSKMNETSRVFNVTVAVEEFSDDSNSRAMQIDDIVDSLPILNREDILNEANRISEVSNNLADKLLSIEVKNGLGLYHKYVPSLFEMKIQSVMEQWNEWQKLMNIKYRGSPLFYKCYICKLSWWHFYDFREHMREHEFFILDLEKETVCEVNIIAYWKSKESVESESFITEGDCPKCGYSYHAHRKDFYRCGAVRCSKKFATCLALKHHEETSHTLLQLTGTPSTSKQWQKACEICHIVFDWNGYNKHMNLMHTVRSDVLVPFDYKKCLSCRSNYVCDKAHNCESKPRIEVFCRHCYRVLSNELQHFDKNLGCLCKICTGVLNKKCMEAEHLMTHTDKFIMVKKCIFCEDFQVFLNDAVAETHRHKEHSQFKIRDMNCFYSIIIPKSCLTGTTAIAKREMSPVAHITIKKEPIEEWAEPKLHINIKQEITGDEFHTGLNDEEISIKQELIYDETSSQSKDCNINIDNNYEDSEGVTGFKLEDIKDEPEDDYEDDIIKLDFNYPDMLQENQQECSQDELQDSMDLLHVMKEDKTRTENKKKQREKRKLYRCKECGFEAIHKEFKKHTHIPITKFLDDKRFYRCSKCGVSFDTFESYVSHYPEHNLKYMSCPECFKEHENLEQLITHIMMHVRKIFRLIKVYTESEKKPVYKCQVCCDSVSQYNFFEHWERHLTWVEINIPKARQEKYLPVIHNLYKSVDEQLLQELIKRLQSPEVRSSIRQGCIICHKHFSRKNDCKRHLIEHLLSDALSKAFDNDGIKCQICGKIFQKPDKYKGHMRDHGYLPVYQCVICDKSFSDSSNFTKHKKIHNVNAYTCDTCGRKFQAKISIERHVKIHETQLPMMCDICDKIFYFQATYKKHYRTHKPAKYRCTVCNEIFSCLKLKWDHLWKAHKLRSQKADCLICKKSFRKFNDLKQHCKIEHHLNVSKLNSNSSEGSSEVNGSPA